MNASVARTRSLRSDVLVIFALQAAGLVVSLLSSVIVARSLGPEGKGVVDYYLLLVYFVTEFGSLGLASGIVYMLTRQGVSARSGHGVSVVLSLVLGSLVGVSLYLYSALSSPMYAFPALLAALCTPFALYRLFFGNLVTSMDKASLNYWASFVSTLFVGLITLLLWMAGWLNAGSLMVLTLLSTMVMATLGGIYLWKQVGVTWSSADAKQAFNHGITIYPGHLINTLHFRADQYVVLHFLGPAALGVYALAARLAEMFWMLDQAIISASLYRITTLDAEGSWALTKRLVMLVASLGIAALFGAYVVGEEAITRLFGSEFQASYGVFLPLLAGSIAWSLARILTQHLGFRLGRLIDCTRGAFIGGAVNLSLLALLFLERTHFELKNIALVSCLSYTLTALVYYVLVLKARKDGSFEQVPK